jgi:hypothetical protein
VSDWENWLFEEDDDAEAAWEIADDHVVEIWFDDDEDARWAVPGTAVTEMATALQESTDEDQQLLGEMMELYARAVGVRTGAEHRPAWLAAIEQWASTRETPEPWARRIIESGGREVPFGPRRQRCAPGGPLTELWDERGTTLAASEVRAVGTAEIRQLLDTQRDLAFVLTGSGQPLR